MKKASTPIYKRICTAALCLILLVYAIYHVALGFKKDLELFTVRGTTITDSEIFTGYFFMESTPLTAYGGGNCYYPYQNGERVGVGKIAAYVYRSGSVALTAQIEDLNKQIDILRKGSRIGGTDLDDVQTQIDRLSYEINRMTAEGNTAAATLLGEEMLVYMAKKDLILSGRSSYEAEILSLEMQISTYLSSLGSPAETVFTSESGYFYRYADGLEGIFTTEAAKNLTLTEFDRITSAKGTTASNIVGTLITDHRWYFATKASVSHAEGFTVGETYDCSFSENAYTKSISMKLTSKESNEDYALLVFSCDALPQGFDITRCQRMEAAREEIRGYRVPASEVRVIDGVTVVYIFKEGLSVPREIDIIMEQNGYYIVSAESEGVSNYAMLSQNDLIIVGENGLYDGKIVG